MEEANTFFVAKIAQISNSCCQLLLLFCDYEWPVVHFGASFRARWAHL
jgi:hypothetical protein